MLIIDKLIKWLSSCLNSKKGKLKTNKVQQNLPPLRFNSISLAGRPPKNANVEKDTLYLVATGNEHKWTLFQCPCGCGHVVTLSLQPNHNPHWKLTEGSSNHPTLFPSIWQDTPCLSHFWLKDGRIYWCPDSGTKNPFTLNIST